MTVRLSDYDRAILDGEEGEGPALAMRVLMGTAQAMGAAALLDIVGAHVDGCLYEGQAGLDFALRLVAGGARAKVPTTLNVTSIDLLHPQLVRPPHPAEARALVDAYVELGCSPTWTCAPYQIPESAGLARPCLGDQVAWAESNAIVFANSVLGARTERYGDFLDICAAVTGRAPAAGLHLDQGRLAGFVLSVEPIASRLGDDYVYPLLGLVLGEVALGRVGAIVGLPPDTDEDRLKAIGAAAATSGSVAMFHAVAITPEAPDLDTATGGRAVEVLEVQEQDLERARRSLTTTAGGRVDAVCLGTPHYSLAQMSALARRVEGRKCVRPLYVNTGRHTLAAMSDEERGSLVETGVTVVTDTCTYLVPVLAPGVRTVMTDSAKWAYYAPANLGVDVVYASQEECVLFATGGGG
ncbi:MAG: aconitase X catalytic domain-containing protein [Acidimicrobiia bacterium]